MSDDTVTSKTHVFQWRWGSNGEWHDYEDGNHPIERRAVLGPDVVCPLCKGPHTLSQCPRWRPLDKRPE